MGQINVQFGSYKAPSIEKSVKRVYRGMFFDGTGNNRFNVAHKNARTPLYEIRKDDTSYSYKTDYTNVARIYSCSPSDYAIYIDGTGTKANKEDDKLEGLALGTGKYGVPARVTEACNLLADSLKPLKNIQTLVVDAYGFSRGAATARSFVANISSKENKKLFKNPLQEEWNHYRGALGMALKKSGIIVEKLEIRFLCIFDTVSSYNYAINIKPNFEDDIGELRLNNLGLVKHIMHFTAEDEHREYFALTRVPKRINVHEINLPGVHGDVGGGIASGQELVEKIHESQSFGELLRLKNKLINERWFTDEQLKILKSNAYGTPITKGIPGFYRLQSTKTIKNTYSFTPLGLITKRNFDHIKMVYPPIDEKSISFKYKPDEYTKKLINLINKNFLETSKLVSPLSLKQYDGTLMKLVENQSMENDEQLSGELLELLINLRSKLLHWTSRLDSLGMQPANNRKRIELRS